MGCGSSKEKVCRNCQAPYVPVKRAYSMHTRRPSHNTEDSRHLVALNSSNLGSFKVDPLILRNRLIDIEAECISPPSRNRSFTEDKFPVKDRKPTAEEEFISGMTEAKTWSKKINEKIPKIIPKTPIRTPPGEPEMINAWEMMEGLEDITPPRPCHHFRSSSFHLPRHSNPSFINDLQASRLKQNGNSSPNPLWLDSDNSDSNSNDTSVSSSFDPQVIATFTNKVKCCPKERLIVYFTSLRGVRKTYEDCCQVQVILKGLGVKVDERDVSMHSIYKDELKELMKDGIGSHGLPRVFVGKTYIGGAEEIQRLNEEGELQNLVKNCEFFSDGNVCEACGDVRFVPCETCSGSCKIYYEDEEEEDYEENDVPYGFQRCPDCNENGLILCPICCD